MAKVLVVDDDPLSRQLFQSLLTPFGHELIEAGDGEEGLRMARERMPDLVITDILMPTMNGYQFVTLLKQIPELRNVPVVFHSASFLDRETRALGASCGVEHFICKPCDAERMLDVVHRALGIQWDARKMTPRADAGGEAIPFLIDAFYEKGKQFDALSVRLASLIETIFDLARTQEPVVLLEKAAHGARKLIGANFAGVGIVEKGAGTLCAFVGSGFDPAALGRDGVPAFTGAVFQELLSGRKPRRIVNSSGRPEALGLPPNHPAVRSFLGVPLAAGERVYGWIYLAERLAVPEFAEEDERILMALSAQVGVAYENALQYHTIQAHATKLEAEVQERKRAEDRFRMLVETAPTGILITDHLGRIVEINAQAERMFGYTREEIAGQNVEMLLPESARAQHVEHRARYAQDPHARPMGLGLELFARRKDGRQFPVEISLGPLATREGILVSSTIIDITARKQMEQQLRQAQRMEAIGKLAGGVAHDFNNLLGVILGCTELMFTELPPEHPVLARANTVKKAADSACELTRQLLAFSRQQMLHPVVLDLRETLRGVETLVRRLTGEHIELHFSLPEKLGSVRADPGQIEQVMMNLVVNARDAMPSGGRLSIELQNVDLDESYRDSHQPVSPGSYVLLAVEDTGCGMSPQVQQHIFDPFFTTKEVGKGTGMGLAMVYGIVKQSGGFIWVYSEVGRGTAFKIYLPRVQEAAQPIHKEQEEPACDLRGNETILLVEDADSLREMSQEYLQSLGYVVMAAESGAAALRTIRDYAGPIHLLLTDVIMPEMGGRELAEQLLQSRPEIKVLFTSGYTNDTMMLQSKLQPDAAFIQKPYRPQALASKVRKVLGERARPAVSQS